ncbi:UDP-N-acetylglucosamine 1-carboxyvinyltransferase [bacterium]|nr:UDP-N-acetylglucosamine 1-carboxyvinyltransferase [bacterium]
MDKFVVKGRTRLVGEVDVKASKNAILPILAASLLPRKGEIILNNVPNIADINTMVKILVELGSEVEHDAEAHRLSIHPENVNSYETPYNLVRKMRASFLLLGPLLVRFGRAKISLPGGCSIGARPVNFHLAGLARLGAKVVEEHGYIEASAEYLTGNTIYFDRPSHTGTENILMAATLAKGTTTIVNAACDPEVVDLANFLNQMGARIYGAGQPTVIIEGVETLDAVEYTPIGDRLEAGTLLFAALAVQGDIKVRGINPDHLTIVLSKMKDMGAELETTPDSVRLRISGRPRGINIITYPFPGFPTDLQATAMSAMAIAEGTSTIKETVFENRFLHVMELIRLGASITILGDTCSISGVNSLDGAEVMASDIRAGAGLVLAGLAAQGETEILRVYHIDRGYEALERSLNSLGAQIARVPQ